MRFLYIAHTIRGGQSSTALRNRTQQISREGTEERTSYLAVYQYLGSRVHHWLEEWLRRPVVRTMGTCQSASLAPAGTLLHSFVEVVVAAVVAALAAAAAVVVVVVETAPPATDFAVQGRLDILPHRRIGRTQFAVAVRVADLAGLLEHKQTRKMNHPHLGNPTLSAAEAMILAAEQYDKAKEEEHQDGVAVCLPHLPHQHHRCPGTSAQ